MLASQSSELYFALTFCTHPTCMRATVNMHVAINVAVVWQDPHTMSTELTMLNKKFAGTGIVVTPRTQCVPLLVACLSTDLSHPSFITDEPFPFLSLSLSRLVVSHTGSHPLLVCDERNANVHPMIVPCPKTLVLSRASKYQHIRPILPHRSTSVSGCVCVCSHETCRFCQPPSRRMSIVQYRSGLPMLASIHPRECFAIVAAKFVSSNACIHSVS
jgi:hypothetical protein